MEKHYIIYGNRAEEMARAIMERMNIFRELASLKKENPLVCLKPNLVVAQPAQWGVTTDPGPAGGIIGYLREHGYINIVIMESAWVGDDTAKAFELCVYRQIAAEYPVPLVDLKRDRVVTSTADGPDIEICARMLEVGRVGRPLQEELGVGTCTGGCRRHVPGCPPRAGDIAAALRFWIRK